MSRMHTGDHAAHEDDQDELERLIREGVHVDQNPLRNANAGVTQPRYPHTPYTTTYEEENEDEDVSTTHDLQGALGLYAEAAADMATAGVELCVRGFLQSGSREGSPGGKFAALRSSFDV